MTRQECESKIAKKLWEIRDIMQEFYPGWEKNQPLCINCMVDSVFAFRLKTDEEGEIIEPIEYIIDVCEREDNRNA